MGRRRSQKLVQRPSRPSSPKSSPSAPAQKNKFRKEHLSSKPHFNHQVSKSTRPSIPIAGNNSNLKRQKPKTSSCVKVINPLKRKLAEDFGPFKRVCFSVTGLESNSVYEDLTPRSTSAKSDRQSYLYNIRRKVSPHVAKIRAKKTISEKMRGDWSGMPTTAQQGLQNLTGALCYRLSLLQALMHQPQFCRWLEKSHQVHECVSNSKGRCVACCLRIFARAYWNGDSRRTLLTLQKMDKLFDSLDWATDSVLGHADPHEMLTWILRQLSKVVPKTSLLAFESINQLDTSSVIFCPRCGYESETSGHEEGALQVSLRPLIRHGTVSGYIQQHMAETLSDYRCEGCNDVRSVKTRKHVINFGCDLLTVQLKRMDAWGRKLDTPVYIERELDLSEYQDGESKEPLRYEIVSVIKHKGTSDFGHYICFTKAGDGKWYEFDDDHKMESDFDEATSQAGHFTPYMLFYQRIVN